MSPFQEGRRIPRLHYFRGASKPNRTKGEGSYLSAGSSGPRQCAEMDLKKESRLHLLWKDD